MTTWKICDLVPGAIELHTDGADRPHYHFPMLMVTVRVGRLILPEHRNAVERWQADPEQDALRARGDPRWGASCRFTATPTVEGWAHPGQPVTTWHQPMPHLGDPGGYEPVDSDADIRPIPF